MSSQSVHKLSIMFKELRCGGSLFVLPCTTWRTTAFALILLCAPYHHLVTSNIYPTFCTSDSEDSPHSSPCGPGKVCLAYECVCDANANLVYDDELDNCTLTAGSDCWDPALLDFLCVLNAECDDETGRCTCDPGFEADLSGECRKAYSEPCDVDALCDPNAFLVCSNASKTCVCRGDGDMLYDPERRKCVAVAKTYCEFESYVRIRRDCVPHAECLPDPELEGHSDAQYLGVCECLPGFEANEESGSCVREYLGECHLSSDCKTGFCNSVTRSCDCPPETSAFDPELKTCGLKLGEPCLVGDDVPSQSRCLSSLICDPESKTCGCPQGFEVDKKLLGMDNNNNNVSCVFGEYAAKPQADEPPLVSASTVHFESFESLALLLAASVFKYNFRN